MTALVLACLHHLLAFGLVAVAAGEFACLSRDLTPEGLARLARLDMHYGVMAGLLIAVGVCRVVWGGKGWPFYLHNPAFWVKMALFAAVGALSAPPTVTIMKWRRLGAVVSAAEAAPLRRLVAIELGLLFLIPLAAAVMARYPG